MEHWPPIEAKEGDVIVGMTLPVLIAALIAAALVGSGVSRLLHQDPRSVMPVWFILTVGGVILGWSLTQMVFRPG